MDSKTFPVPDDIRFGEIIRKEEGKQKDFFGDLVLLGFPYDIGVSRNGGRVGASDGPASLRK
jgi:arginase family enzyme